VELPIIGTFEREEFPEMSYETIKNDSFAKNYPKEYAALKEFIKAKYHFENYNDAARAATHLQKACELDPGNPSYFFEQAIVRLRLKEYDKALWALNRILEIEPRPDQLENIALYYRGLVYAFKGKFEEALSDYGRLLAKEGVDAKLRRAAIKAQKRATKRRSGQITLARLNLMMQQCDLLEY
jgi:tetratricopeptide (TPR) repeat protein